MDVQILPSRVVDGVADVLEGCSAQRQPAGLEYFFTIQDEVGAGGKRQGVLLKRTPPLTAPARRGPTTLLVVYWEGVHVLRSPNKEGGAIQSPSPPLVLASLFDCLHPVVAWTSGQWLARGVGCQTSDDRLRGGCFSWMTFGPCREMGRLCRCA